MANPTTYFGWVMPNSADLVTDLPADFNVFGQGVDTSMQYLLGGTTGQVLAKTSATNMAFTWTTPTDQTPLTTKGDLFTFTTVDARLAVGNNGETLVADSAATTGLRYSATPSASNPVINSAMQNWQRGTSFSLSASASNTYTADRFSVLTNANQATTISRQTTSDTTNLPNIQYALRFQRNSGQTGTGTMQLAQTLETVNSIPFAGKAVTVSYYAKAGANYSPTSAALGAFLATGTGTDQSIFTPFTGVSYSITGSATLTTTWQRFTFTGTVPTTATQLAVLYNFTPVGTASTNDWFEVTGVQIDIGSVALPFRTYAATIQGELAACQRYFQKTNNQSEAPATAPTSTPINAINASTTLVVGVPPFKVLMRTAPTVTLYSPVTGTSGRIRSGGADVVASAADVGEYTIGYISATGLTAGSNSAISFIASSEL